MTMGIPPVAQSADLITIATQVVSALLRLLPMLVCFEVQVLTARNRPNFANAPRFVGPAFAIAGTILAGNIADLTYRAATLRPPSILWSGYTLTLGMLAIAVAGHLWLQHSWLPQNVRASFENKMAVWRGLMPCVRRDKVKRERSRMNRAAKFGTDTFLAQVASQPPLIADMDDVIPDSLRERS